MKIPDDVEFTQKSKSVEDLIEDIVGRKREAGHCVFEDMYSNDEHNLEFKDDLSRKEFRISGLCQTCQDKVFGDA